MTVKAFAKVNLTLEVYGKRPDGFHELSSIVQPISLFDTLEIERTDDGSVSSDTGYGEQDLIVHAARLLKVGARIQVIKRIPAGGGLGGGSADAAATLLSLNELYALGKTPAELAALGAAIGSDVPALVLAQHYRSPVLMTGRGERVSRMDESLFVSLGLPSRPYLVLVNPGVSSSTAEVYKHCTARTSPAVGMVNDLEAPACRLYPEISKALDALRAAGAKKVMMSGSGATVFGFAESLAIAERIADSLCSRYPFVHISSFLN